MGEHENEAKKERDYRGLATLVASITALLTAIAAIVKPPSTIVPQRVYETLVEGIEHNQRDIAELRGYIEGVEGIRPSSKPATFESLLSDDIPPLPVPSVSAASSGKPPAAAKPVVAAMPKMLPVSQPTFVPLTVPTSVPTPLPSPMASAAPLASGAPSASAAPVASSTPPDGGVEAAVMSLLRAEQEKRKAEHKASKKEAAWKPKPWSDIASGK
jgi:hypothetical protein